MSFDHTDNVHQFPPSGSRRRRIREARREYDRALRASPGHLGEPRDDTAEEAARRQRARDIAARVRRANRATVLVNRGKTGLTDETETALTDAQAHHQRALEHHEAVAEHHASADGHISKLRGVHRKLTSTLEDLGIEDNRMSRALAAFDSHIDDLRSDYENAADVHGHCGAEVEAAERCVRSVVVGGLEQSEPPDDDSKDIKP